MCFSFLLGICLGLKLLGHISSMFNISRLCQTPLQRCRPILQSYQQWGVPVFRHPCQHLLWPLSLFILPFGAKRYLMAPVFIFLMPNVAEHLFTCLLAISSLETCLQVLELFVFLLSCMYSYILDASLLLDNDLQIFFPLRGLSLHFINGVLWSTDF